MTRSVANNDGEKGEPTAKRVALTDVTHAVSNIHINSSKKKTALQTNNVKHGESSRKDRRKPVQSQKDVPASPDPCPGFDFDKENAGDLLCVSDYAFDIFRYYKMRESSFRVNDYTKRQRYITKEMRAVLVDWMVEVQENFELNHETLYLAVKLMDTYMSKTQESITRDNSQLICSAAIFIASKYDERSPPLIDDFLYVCEDKFTRDELCETERKMFKVVGFDIGMPLSYRFLRRYAKVSKVDIATLTLSRYILETSLIFAEFIMVPESLMAAAAFLLALRMKKIGDWNPVLKKYSGYKLEDVEPLMWSLNHMMRARPTVHGRLNNIFSKYSHEVFFGVAKTPLLANCKSSSEPVGPPASLKLY
uniref:G2/mitotic-specific cyclin-B3 n=1 Tax=Steinernema glaseri TaxID=37863 RepID=A0A1I7YH89_9BILA